MELAYQWDLVEDEVSVVFESLLDTIKSELGYLKDQVKSEFHLHRMSHPGSTNQLGADSASTSVSDALSEAINTKITGLQYTIGLEKEKFASSIRLVIFPMPCMETREILILP